MTAHTHLQVAFWSRIARSYAASPISDEAGYENTLRRVLALLRPELEVLEVGCGTGTTALRLADRVKRYLATDVAPEMVNIARQKLQASPVSGLQFEVADACEPPAGSYDLVLAFNAIHLLPDLDAGLAALLRALKPGGLFVSKTPCVGEMNPFITRLALPIARLIRKAPPVLVFKEAQLTEALERQGLHLEAVERHGTRGKDSRVFIIARKL